MLKKFYDTRPKAKVKVNNVRMPHRHNHPALKDESQQRIIISKMI